MNRALGRSVIAISFSSIFASAGCGGSGEAGVAGAPAPPAAPAAPYSATVSWSVPALNTDGTLLTDITGYRVYYGNDALNLTQSVLVAGAGNTSHVVGGLSQGTYYFAVATLNSMGVVSDLSNTASRIVP